jgi:hypothetical protein
MSSIHEAETFRAGTASLPGRGQRADQWRPRT